MVKFTQEVRRIYGSALTNTIKAYLHIPKVEAHLF